MRKAWNLESGLSFDMDLDRDSYDFIIQMIEPEFIMSALRKIYKDIDRPEELSQNKRVIPLEERAALAFSLLHKQVQQERTEEVGA